MSRRREVVWTLDNPVTDGIGYPCCMGTLVPAEVKADLMFLLSQASHVLMTEMTAGLAEVGISPRAYCVLSHGMVGDLTQIRLAEVCGLDKTTMVVTLDELERAGLAERRPSSTDRRVRIVAVTEAGAAKVAEAHKVVAEIYDDVLGSLPDDEREPFLNGLVRLVGDRLSTPVHCQRPVRRRSPKA
jgi:MarR family transcriptional regulator, transcriptional regulator for hemolysin